MASPPTLSPVLEDEGAIARPSQMSKATQEKVDWSKITDPGQLEKGRRTAKASHTRARNAILECVHRRGSADEFHDLIELLTREYDQVVKRHRRYLQFVEFDSDELEEQRDWLRLVREDHEKALNSIPFGVETPNESAQSRPDTPAIQSHRVRTDVQLIVDADMEGNHEDTASHSSEFEQAVVRPISSLSVQSLPGPRSATTPPLSNGMPPYSAPGNPFQRVVQQVGNFTSRAIGFFTPKRVQPPQAYARSQQPQGPRASVQQPPRSSAQAAPVQSFRPVARNPVEADRQPPP